MVGKMKKTLCLLFVLFCVGGVHAATMCVPDLSTCTSCTDASYQGITWTANCCGVKVSGVTMLVIGGSWVGASYNIKNDARLELFNAYGTTSYTSWCGCLMLKPVVAEHVTVVGYNYDHTDLGYCVKECAESFDPSRSYAEHTEHSGGAD